MSANLNSTLVFTTIPRFSLWTRQKRNVAHYCTYVMICYRAINIILNHFGIWSRKVSEVDVFSRVQIEASVQNA